MVCIGWIPLLWSFLWFSGMKTGGLSPPVCQVDLLAFGLFGLLLNLGEGPGVVFGEPEPAEERPAAPQEATATEPQPGELAALGCGGCGAGGGRRGRGGSGGTGGSGIRGVRVIGVRIRGAGSE